MGTAIGQTGANLSWNASTDNVGVAGYVVSRDGAWIATVATTVYTDTGLSPGTTHTYFVAAKDAAGNMSPNSTSVSVTTASVADTIPPTQPAGFTVSALGSTGATLSWNPSTDNVGVTGYIVSRNGTRIGTPTTTAYTDTGLLAGTTYIYTVLARDAAGNTSGSASASVTTAAAPPVPLPGPGWPIGIPGPSFGIAESLPPIPSPWTAAIAGTYFVCPACAGSTDAVNPNGFPGKPRQTIPNPLSGPALVVLDGQIDSNMSFTGNGTAANPIFVTSLNPSVPAKLTVDLVPSGAYIIFDHLWLATAGFGLNEGAADHIALRNSELSGDGTTKSGGIGLGTWSYTGAQSVSNIVIDHNNIHDIGDVSALLDQDAHCITLNGSDDHVWVTFNTLTRCSGDAMQVEAQQGRRDKIHHIYYGKNVASNHRQSGGWVKNATDVIFSQNITHDFRNNSGGPGACYGFQYDAEYVWFLYNEGYACNVGINIASSDISPGTFAAIIGNIIHDQAGQQPTNPYNGGAIVVRGGTNVYVVNNTLANVDAGINMPPGTNAVTIQNNIIKTSGTQLYTEGSVTLTVSNNLFSANNFTGATAGTNAKIGDPLFVSATDFHLQGTSPAIDAGVLSSVYATFLNRYGISIALDADANSRPAGVAWDLGAYEKN